jgi:hypothetical protein
VSLEYKFRDSDGETESCDSCGFRAPTAEFDWGPVFPAKHAKPFRLLCEYCSTTMASRYTEYPQTDEYGLFRAETWRASACLFNALKFGLNGAAPASPPMDRPTQGDMP